MIMLLGAFMAISCGSSGPTKASVAPVRIALTNVPIAYMPVILAEQLGYYRKEGLSVTIDDFSSSSKAMQALLGGSADVAAGPYEQDIQMAAEGRPIKSFILMLRHSLRVLVVAPHRTRTIRRLEDLKGATVGVAGLGLANQFFLNYVLLKHGLAPEDVKVVGIGTGASAVAAVEHGLVDAAVLSGSESTVALKRARGASILLDARGMAGSRQFYGVDTYPNAVLHATDPWLEQHPDTARRVVRAIQRTLTWISQHSPEQIWAALPERYRLPDREAELEALRITVPSFSPDGVMPADGAEAVRKALAFSIEKVRQAHFNLEQTYTNQFVQETGN
jgi:NitT/TauT family transport system substrate-binding protein